MSMLQLIDDILTGIVRDINPFDRKGLFSDDDDLCDHCGKLLIFSSSGLCDDCKRKAGYSRSSDD